MEDVTKELHGVDLEKWTYLGYTKIKQKHPTKISSYIFYFSERANEEHGKRMYVHVGKNSKDMKDHVFLLINSELWKIGEYEFAATVETEPSNWLIEWMQEVNGITWVWDEGWVAYEEEDKYEQAVEEQKMKPKDKKARDFKVLSFKKKDEPKSDSDGQDIPKK